jgi:hypothetical protein
MYSSALLDDTEQYLTATTTTTRGKDVGLGTLWIAAPRLAIVSHGMA